MIDAIKCGKALFFPDFATPVPGTLREVLDKYTTTRERIYPNALETSKGESGGASMMMKTGTEVA